MRVLYKLIAGATVLSAATALAMGPALADPQNSHGKPIEPAEFDVVGVGSDTSEFLLDQLSLNYNAAHKADTAAHPHLYSWDATSPGSIFRGGFLATKTNCAREVRPAGSSAGIKDFIRNQKTKDKKFFCDDFSRSSRGRAATDPAKGPGGIEFVALAGDAETWATNKVTNAPKSLTLAQLIKIYTCQVTNWDQVGGKNAPIDAQIAQVQSGTYAFWIKALGIISQGSCVGTSAEENEGLNKVLRGPNVIINYSIGRWLAQAFHSAVCGKKPGPGQNLYGCQKNGKLVLHQISRTNPTTGTGKTAVINKRFPANFQRIIFNVVRWTKGTRSNIPSRLYRFFGRTGYFCTSKTARADIVDYGFLPEPALCGLTF